MWQVLSEFPDEAGWLVKNTIGLEVYRYIGFVKRGFNPQDNPYFMDREVLFNVINKQLSLVKSIASELKSAGLLVTFDSLVEKVGFQHRQYVNWYLDGIEEVTSEKSFMKTPHKKAFSFLKKKLLGRTKSSN